MIKKLLFAAACITMNAHSMDHQVSDKVRNAQTATVLAHLDKESFDIPINNTNTMLDLKNHLRGELGVPVGQQVLIASWKTWKLTLAGWATDYSVPLANDLNVREVMNLYNTTTFRLILQRTIIHQ